MNASKEILQLLINKETRQLGLNLMCKEYKLTILKYKKQFLVSSHYDYVIIQFKSKYKEEFFLFLDYLETYNPYVMETNKKDPSRMSFLSYGAYDLTTNLNAMKLVFQDI